MSQRRPGSEATTLEAGYATARGIEPQDRRPLTAHARRGRARPDAGHRRVHNPPTINEKKIKRPGRRGDRPRSFRDDLLYTLTTACVELLDVDAAGILLIDEQGHLVPVAAPHDGSEHLEQLQILTREGPCFDAVRPRESVSSSNLDHQARGQLWSMRGMTTSRRSRRPAAATGMATMAPMGPSSEAPRTTATRVTRAGTLTVRPMMRGSRT